jgi:hypothetical protein
VNAGVSLVPAKVSSNRTADCSVRDSCRCFSGVAALEGVHRSLGTVRAAPAWNADVPGHHGNGPAPTVTVPIVLTGGLAVAAVTCSRSASTSAND